MGRFRNKKKELLFALMSLACSLSIVGTAAAQYNSPHYQTNEVFFGSGGGSGFSSNNYQAQVSVGETGVAGSCSPSSRLALDSSSPSPTWNGGTGANATSNSFTPPANSVIVVNAVVDSTGVGTWTSSITDSLSTHLTWHQITQQVAGDGVGMVVAWWADAGSSAPGSMTVTVTTNGNGSGGLELSTLVLTGADTSNPIGATINGSLPASDTALSEPITPHKSGSALFMGAVQPFGGTFSAGSGNNILALAPNPHLAEDDIGTSGGPTLTTSTASQTFSINSSGTGPNDWAYVGFEVQSATGYCAQSGFNTSDAPVLEVNVNGGIQDLGLVDASSTKYASTTFTIRDYLSSGYVADIYGSPPTNGFNGHVINSCSSPCTATPGAEQFGINLAANSSIGAAPVQTADTGSYPTFGYGAATPNYGQPNKYTFNSGDTIASSSSSSGETKYTMSIMMDVAASTPAGVYGDLDGMYGGSLYVIAVATY